MAIPHHKDVSSIESIQSSIETDRQVYRWFLMLISCPTIKARLGHTEETMKICAYLRLTILAEIGISMSLCVWIIYLFLSKERALLLVGVILLYGLHKVHALNRRYVAKISVDLLNGDFQPPTINTQTLFQVCEHYANRLNIPSLVDTITSQDSIARTTLIYANIFACFIYPMGFWYIWLVILSSFYLMIAVINTSFIFNKLR
jgi:hypothetical protein